MRASLQKSKQDTYEFILADDTSPLHKSQTIFKIFLFSHALVVEDFFGRERSLGLIADLQLALHDRCQRAVLDLRHFQFDRLQ